MSHDAVKQLWIIAGQNSSNEDTGACKGQGYSGRCPGKLKYSDADLAKHWTFACPFAFSQKKLNALKGYIQDHRFCSINSRVEKVQSFQSWLAE